jgi:uncharacterized membrane protein YphA (DoxX/SURF4 family)
MIHKRTEPVWLWLVRVVTGLIFVFSSFVKGVDPLGTDYRVVDYLDAYGWFWMVDYSFYLSLFLISVEFLLGIALLFRLKYKLVSLGVLLMMLIFLVVTFFDALYNMVPDCGCFGDAVKLTNWETFYKNIVIVVFAIILFVNRNKQARKMKQTVQMFLLVLFLGAFSWFIGFNINHLPVIDFRAWEVGNDMKTTGRETVVNYLVYKNKTTGEIKEYVSPNYPWNDSVWMSEWEFVRQRIDDSGLNLKHGLIIEDELGNILTDQIIENPDYQFILAVYDIVDADDEGMIKAAEIYNNLDDINAGFDMITSSTPELISEYADKYSIDYGVYYGDDIELKAMIRSNPGLVLLKEGIVIEKWHYNDFPNIDQLREMLKDD